MLAVVTDVSIDKSDCIGSTGETASAAATDPAVVAAAGGGAAVVAAVGVAAGAAGLVFSGRVATGICTDLGLVGVSEAHDDNGHTGDDALPTCEVSSAMESEHSDEHRRLRSCQAEKCGDSWRRRMAITRFWAQVSRDSDVSLPGVAGSRQVLLLVLVVVLVFAGVLGCRDAERRSLCEGRGCVTGVRSGGRTSTTEPQAEIDDVGVDGT